ncbi:MAG: GlmL-related ornithine degradation protein [Candidatus Izemoplasmatales bacterium]
MKVDAFVAEIGSTTTILNAFDNLDSENPLFLGSGYAPTSVLEGDVLVGLEAAKVDLMKKLNTDELLAKETFASSSAAGGLKMSVHGLVYDMTVKAAKEAALGAGANLKMITAGVLDDYQLEEIKDLNLNIIMIAGGVDFGERKTALENSKKIAEMKLDIPVIYAGNIQNHNLVKKIFLENGQDKYLYLSDNVYPKIDVLAVEGARNIIQNVFETHIIKAPGMEKIKAMISDTIIPTPGAVMEASKLLSDNIGDLITVDIGGATTDIHSVTEGKEEISKILIAPEPKAKRTVEGDLGVYINKDNIINIIGLDNLSKELKIEKHNLEELIKEYKPIPEGLQIALTTRLTQEAFDIALKRHSGKIVYLYNSSGKKAYAEGKDLTNVKYIIGTGGALTRLSNGSKIIKDVIKAQNDLLLVPSSSSLVLIDKNYIMASLGVLSKKHPSAALKLMKSSLEIE